MLQVGLTVLENEGFCYRPNTSAGPEQQTWGIKELVQSEAPTPKGQGGGKAPGRAQLPGAPPIKTSLFRRPPPASPCTREGESE